MESGISCDRQQFQSRPFERGSNSGLRGDREHGDPVQANGGNQGEQNGYNGGQKLFSRPRYQANVKQEQFGIGREKDGGFGGFGPPRCFQCGKKGHKSFDCPHRIGRVTSPGIENGIAHSRR